MLVIPNENCCSASEWLKHRYVVLQDGPLTSTVDQYCRLGWYRRAASLDNKSVFNLTLHADC